MTHADVHHFSRFLFSSFSIARPITTENYLYASCVLSWWPYTEWYLPQLKSYSAFWPPFCSFRSGFCWYTAPIVLREASYRPWASYCKLWGRKRHLSALILSILLLCFLLLLLLMLLVVLIILSLDCGISVATLQDRPCNFWWILLEILLVSNGSKLWCSHLSGSYLLSLINGRVETTSISICCYLNIA